MDLDTENRLAALLMEEARRLHAEADKDGVHAYLNRKVRARPNSRFLTATVLGVQHANKAVEVDEMWRAREKELDLKNRSVHKAKEIRECSERDRTSRVGYNRTQRGKETCKDTEYSHNVPQKQDVSSIDDDGLKDEDVEQFLNSRVKRGRGAVGSRMDESGPYPTCGPSNQEGNKATSSEFRVLEDWERKFLGPEKPPSYRSYDNSEEVPSKTKKSEKSKSRSKKRYSSDNCSGHDKHRKKRRTESKEEKERKLKHRK